MRIHITTGALDRLAEAATRTQAEDYSEVIERALDALEAKTPFGPEQPRPEGVEIPFCPEADREPGDDCNCTEPEPNPRSRAGRDFPGETDALGEAMITARAYGVARNIIDAHDAGIATRLDLIALGYLRGQSDGIRETVSEFRNDRATGGGE